MARVYYLMALAVLMLVGQVVDAQEKDVSFFVVGKATRFVQDFDGDVTTKGVYFFGEIFLNQDGAVEGPHLSTPNREFTEFSSNRNGSLRSVPRQDFESIEELDAAFPDGKYSMSAKSASGEMVDHSVTFRNREDHPDRFPHPVQVFFSQGGSFVDPQTIDSQQDLIISWTPFRSGRADPQRISGDLIFAIGSTDGEPESPFRSELPFKSIPALSYNDQSFRIPCERLVSGKTYSMVVEHALLAETNRQSGVVGLAAFASLTTAKFMVK